MAWVYYGLNRERVNLSLDVVDMNTEANIDGVYGMIWNRHCSLFLILLAVVAVFGIYLRVRSISRGLEYDEIWTWNKYASQGVTVIFSDLRSTNNHTLQTLAAKFSTDLFGKTSFALRLPALIAGLLIPVFAGFLTWRLLRNKTALLLAFSICTFNGFLVSMSQTARGYTMQILFVLLAGISLFAMCNSKTERRFAPVIFLFSAIATVLTMPSGIIFIAPLCLLWFLYNAEWHSLRKWIADKWPFILSFFIFGVICLIWYGKNYTNLRTAQTTFGDDISSPFLFFSFAWEMLWIISGFTWILMFVPLFSKEGRRTTGLCVFFVILVALSAPFTTCGVKFSKVYLPLIPFIALGAADGFVTLVSGLPQVYEKLRYVICGAFISLLAVNASLSNMINVEWAVVTPEIVKAFPKDVFINYLPTDTYPIWFHCRNFVMTDNFERIAKFSGTFAQVGAPGTITGQEAVTDGNAWLSVEPAYIRGRTVIAGVNVEIFRFRPITQNDLLKDRIVLAMVGPTKDKEMYDRLVSSFFIPYKWLLLNSNFRASKQRFKDGLPVVEALATNACDAPASGLLELEELSKGTVHFFILESSK